MAKNSLWYLDLADSHEVRPAQATYNAGLHARQALTSDSKSVNVTILLNSYSFFETLEGRLLPPMQLKIELELTPDSEALYGAVDTARLVIDRFYLWVPRLEPKYSLMSKFVSEYQKPSKWTNLRELFETSDVFRNSGDFRISPSIDKVKHVFIYAQRAKTKDMTENPYIFDTFKLNEGNNDSYIQTCRLEYGNGTFYPNMPMKVLVKAESFPI